MSEPMTEIVDLPTAEQRARAVRAALRRARAHRVRQPGQDLQGRRPRGRGPPGARPARRERRVHRPGRRLGVGQEHAPQHPGRARRAVGGSCRGRRSRPRRDGLARADALPPPRHRLRLAADVAQPAAVPDRARRTSPCRWSSTAMSAADRDAFARELLDAGRPGRSGRPPAGADVRRGAAARRHRGRAGQPARGPARRRADRRARHRDRAPDLRPVPAPQPRARRHDRRSRPTTRSSATR